MTNNQEAADAAPTNRIEPVLSERDVPFAGTGASIADQSGSPAGAEFEGVRNGTIAASSHNAQSALLTTVFVSACLSVAATIAYTHLFPSEQNNVLPPVMAVDMMQVSSAVAKMSEGNIEEAERLFKIGAESMERLREAGVVVVDVRSVISVPETALLSPSDLIPGAPDTMESMPRVPSADLFDGSDLRASIEASKDEVSGDGAQNARGVR